MGLMIFGGVVLLVIGVLVRIAVGSPYRMILELGIGDLVPPVWLVALLWSVSLFTIGCAGGFVFGYREHGCAAEKYKGCMFFLLLAIMEMLWYPAFFSAGMVFLSVLLAIMILCISVAVTSCYYRVSKFAGMIFLLHDVWLIYMVILNFAVLFRN